MKKYSLYKKIQCILFMLMCFFVFDRSCVFAVDIDQKMQEEDQKTIESMAGAEDYEALNDAELIANVNIAEGKIIEQDGHTVKVEFIIMNDGDTVQPDIRYSTHLLIAEVDEDDPLLTQYESVDEHVFQETLTLAPGEKTTKKLTYEVPRIFSGDYEIGITASTTKGMPLTVDQLGKVNFIDVHEGIEIVDCKLNITNDEKEYALVQGVDIAWDEYILLTCGFVNRFDEEVTVTPYFDTYEQVVFSDLTDTQKSDEITIGAKDYREVTLELPKPEKAQAYDAILTVKDGEDVLSNSILVHYVIQGESGIIQNIQFDKTAYAQGDTARVTFLITSRADFYPESRILEQNQLQENAQEVIYDIEITDENGSVCGSLNDQRVDDFQELAVADVAIQKACKNPRAKAVLKNADGIQMDESDIVVYDEQKASQTWGVGDMSFAPKLLVAVVAMTFIGIIIILLVRRKKGLHVFAFLLLSSTIFMSTNGVQAATITVPGPSSWGGDWAVSVPVNVPSSTSSGSIQVGGQATMQVCGNAVGAATVYVNGSTAGSYYYDGRDASSYHGQRSFWYSKWVALNCGSNRVNVKGKHVWKGDQVTEASRNFYINRPCPSPQCGSRNTTYPATTTAYPYGSTWCASGSTPSNLSGGPYFPDPGTSKTWTCSRSGKIVSCAATRSAVQPTCGSSHTLTYTSRPTTGLCSTGSASWSDSTASDGTWNWTCGSASCYANKKVEPPQPVCGSSNAGTYTSRPTTGLCSTGSASWSDSTASDGTWNWTCGSASCYANKKVVTTPQCTGTVPSGATICYGDSTGLSYSMAWTGVDYCTSRKCEYIRPTSGDQCACGPADGRLDYPATTTYLTQSQMCSSGTPVYQNGTTNVFVGSGLEGALYWNCRSIRGIEECTGATVACTAQRLGACGDGNIGSGEECDDGNIISGDGCSSVCTFEEVCGDGNKGGGEECDDGNVNSGDGCSSSCDIEDTCSSSYTKTYDANADSSEWDAGAFCEGSATLKGDAPSFPEQGRTVHWICELGGLESDCEADRRLGPGVVATPEEEQEIEGRMIETRP